VKIAIKGYPYDRRGAMMRVFTKAEWSEGGRSAIFFERSAFSAERRWIMNNGVTRRDFLKYSLATGMLLAAGEGILNNVLAQTAKGLPRWTS
jgi:TAT (twin-arginine translocation) pathway signal sequence